MIFTFSPQWVHGLKDGKIKSFIVRNESDFKTLILEGGYTDSPFAAKEGTKHPACEFYEPLPDDALEDSEPLLTLDEVKGLPWPRLKSYAKHLEGFYGVEIITGNSKKEDILSKIEELMNADGK